MHFNYRQIVELYIKYLFFKYSFESDAIKVRFVKRVSHKLNKAWAETKPYISMRLEKIGNPLDISLFDDFINQIDIFDADSFRMRYPIKKDLQSVHAGPVKLDVVGLNNKMVALFELFQRLDCEIEGVFINTVCADGFVDTIKGLYQDAQASISKITALLHNLADKEKKQHETRSALQDDIFDMFSIDLAPNSKQQFLEQMLSELPTKHAAVLAILTYAVRSVVNNRCRLAIDREEKMKDFFKLLELMLEECSSFISFDGYYPSNQMCSALLEKSAEVTSWWLDASIHIMESTTQAINGTN